MYKYTVCFVKNENNILMLNREKSPIMGVWNGVGGKIEKGETPDEGALREVFEETGIRVERYFSKGTVSWETSNGERDGIYVYLYEVTNHLKLETPIKTREGILDWKSINWILNPINLGIAEMVSQYLPVLLNKADNYSLKYQDAQIHIN
ncbi:NUDIX hydrolase [Lysinibacillus xylanilyticus]|uniref:DNA mismatch repair protein MutT n=1 Tax=Lysinibacillus xylanilyticus TaxID=582475 RepID=A0A2M9Q6G5_9BACI|nr:8-oxo-dGTP diphosphatase [Lysinibacillus xylanilyticus]PJO43664.1 DNA mismatch repair protein MutT [Lysinibacillus xylanilyticus]